MVPPRSGLAGAAMPVLLAISAAMSLPVMGLRARALLGAVLPPVGAAAAMGLTVTAVARTLPAMSPPATLAVLVPAGVAAYAGFALLLARPLARQGIAMARGRSAA